MISCGGQPPLAKAIIQVDDHAVEPGVAHLPRRNDEGEEVAVAQTAMIVDKDEKASTKMEKKLEGTGIQVTVTTCGAATTVRTLIQVQTVSCDYFMLSNSQCLTNEVYDTICGSSGPGRSVSFPMVSGTEYLILVSRAGDIDTGSTGSKFELSIKDNDSCEFASGPVPANGNSLFGSTVGATVDDNAVACSDASTSVVPGV